MHFDSTYRRFGIIISDEYKSGTAMDMSYREIKLSKIFHVIGYKLLNVHTLIFEDIYNEDGEHTLELDEVGEIKYFGEEYKKNKNSLEEQEYYIGNGLDAMSRVLYPFPVYTRSGDLYVSCVSDSILYRLDTLYAVIVNAKELSVNTICGFAEKDKYDVAMRKYLTNRFGNSYISPTSKNAILDNVSSGIYANDELCYVDSDSTDIVLPKSCKYIYIYNVKNADKLVLGICAEVLECIHNTYTRFSRIKNVYMGKNASKELVGSYLYAMINGVYSISTATSIERNLKREVEVNRQFGYSKIYDICSKEEYKDAIKHILDCINIVVY